MDEQISNISNEETDYKPQWDRLTRWTVAISLVVAGVFALQLIAPVLQLLTVSFIVSFVMYGPARAITKRFSVIPWPVAVAAVYIVLVVVIIITILIIIPAIVNGVNSFIETGQRVYSDFQIRLLEYEPEVDGFIYIFTLRVDINPIIEPIREFALNIETEEDLEDLEAGTLDISEVSQNATFQQFLGNIFNIAGTITGVLTSTITGIADILSTTLLSLFISLLVLLDLQDSRKLLYRITPTSYRREIGLLIRHIQHVWNAFLRGQVTIGIIIGGLTWGQLKLMGIPNAEVLAVITGVISLIPTIGGFIALIPLSIVPLIQGSTVITEVPNGTVMLLVIGGNLIVTQLIWNVIAPKILGDALQLPLPVIIVGVFIGTAAAGILGAFLVAPVFGTVKVVVVYLLHKLAQKDPFPGETLPDDKMPGEPDTVSKEGQAPAAAT